MYNTNVITEGKREKKLLQFQTRNKYTNLYQQTQTYFLFVTLYHKVKNTSSLKK